MRAPNWSRNKLFIGIVFLLLALALIAGIWRFRSRVRVVYNVGRALIASRSVAREGDFTNVLFVHQSTGRGLIADGDMRQLLTEAGYEFWDHDYNYIGLARPDGTLAGYSYNVPDDNTNPDGYADLFSQSVHALPINTLSAILQHEVIVFKSCYPVSDIQSPEQLEEYKRSYLRIRDVADAHLDHVFIALTPPPLVPESTNVENAARAREFATWLKSGEFLDGHPNFHTFDLFTLLAEGDPALPDYNRLQVEYRLGVAGDSHPNPQANQIIGPQLVDFVIRTAEAYQTVR